MTLLHFMADTCEQKVQISMMVVMKVQGITVMKVIFHGILSGVTLFVTPKLYGTDLISW